MLFSSSEKYFINCAGNLSSFCRSNTFVSAFNPNWLFNFAKLVIPEIGKEKLDSWIDIPINALPVVEDLFSLKLFFIQDPNDPRISTLVNKQLDLLEKQLDHLNDREKILFDTQEKRNKNYGHYLILERTISRLDNQIKWLKTIKQR